MIDQTKKHIDLAAIRARLANQKGQRYWQSLDELAETEEFQEFLREEFPHGHADLTSSVSRRTFLKLMGASLALAGLTSCSIGPLQPEERIIPYVVPPAEHTPGIPLFFASSLTQGGFARGVVVESHEFRPTKIEGNRKHPSSLGATDVLTQASILTLYDPDRSQQIVGPQGNSTWQNFTASLPQNGGQVRILTETVTSPTLANQIQALLEANPEAQWYQYDAIGRDNVRAGALLAFDEVVETLYHFDRADIVLSLDADFLAYGPGALVYSRQFMDRRRIRRDFTEMNRLYLAESTPSITGSVADHRLPLRASDIEDLARMVADRLGIDVGSVNEAAPAAWVEALVADLEAHQGRSIVIAGDQQPAAVHALAHAINHALGNVGETVSYIDPVEVNPVDQLDGLQALTSDMKSGNVDLLLIIGGNPVYDAPADLGFADALASVSQSVHLSLYEDETSARCSWHIPEAHVLESWGDARAYDGTVSLIQPLIAPLYGGKTASEVIAAVMGTPDATSHDILREYWRGRLEDVSEKGWELILQDGFIARTAFSSRDVALKEQTISRSSSGGSGLEIVFRPDPTIWDGRFANNAWLQEMPKPFSKVTWENVVMVSLATAIEYGLDNGMLVDLSFNGAAVRGPTWIMPGQADNSVTVLLGGGRTMAGQIGNGLGFDAYPMRTRDTFWFGTGLSMAGTGQTVRLASTQYHFNIFQLKPEHESLAKNIEERIPHHIFMAGTIDQFREAVQANETPSFVHKHKELPSLYPEFETASGAPWEGSEWAMVIDLSVCTGCNACVAACNAENNIPIVGKDEVIRGREMHWIRIDGYYSGEFDNPHFYHMPLGCVHCERAPCEPVCPVEATSHSLEGINEMSYNRCVGTRYCANNCPYKVRRFNFFDFSGQNMDSPTLRLMKNPNVTTRTRGVMEKCSYCVQRINAARIVSKRENIPIEDGTVVPACEAACPTGAITFGNKADTESRVAALKAQPHNYSLLEIVGTVPRTTYLARVRNPNPEIEPPEEGHGGEGH